jgi:hypothetical protein
LLQTMAKRLTMNIHDIIKELEQFSRTILFLGLPGNLDYSQEFEEKYNLRLPKDYKTLLQKYNGVTLMGTSVYGIKTAENPFSLHECYVFEHYNVQNVMPLYLVPFSPDGRGNHYCFDTRFHNDDSCRVLFWQHDYAYSAEDTPEVSNDSFTEWMQEVMIDWTLEDYNYDGTPKS